MTESTSPPSLCTVLAEALRELKLRGSTVSYSADEAHTAHSPYATLYSAGEVPGTAAQISLGTLSHLNTDPDTAEMWTGFGKPWTAVLGFGSLFLGAQYAPLFDSVLGPSKEDELALIDFLDQRLASDWQIPPPFALNFGEQLHIQWNDDKTALAINFIVTLPCSEEVWQRMVRTKQLELKAASALQTYITTQQLMLEQRLAPGSDSIN